MKIIVKSVKAKVYTSKVDVTSCHDCKPKFIDGLKQIEGTIEFSSNCDFSRYLDDKGNLGSDFYYEILNATEIK